MNHLYNISTNNIATGMVRDRRKYAFNPHLKYVFNPAHLLLYGIISFTNSTPTRTGVEILLRAITWLRLHDNPLAPLQMELDVERWAFPMVLSSGASDAAKDVHGWRRSATGRLFRRRGGCGDRARWRAIPCWLAKTD
jgi:hypothetical protein